MCRWGSDRAPRPFLIGVLGMAPGSSVSAQLALRMSVAVHANREGYALADIFEVRGNRLADERVYDAIEMVSDQLDAHTFLVHGDVDEARLAGIAERVRMTVRPLPERVGAVGPS